MKIIRSVALAASLLLGLDGTLRAPRVLTHTLMGGAMGPAPSSRVHVHGLEMSLHTAPGPYFQGEALHVQVSLINQSPTTRWLVAGNIGAGLRLVGSSSLILRAAGEGTPAFLHEPSDPTRPPLPERLDPGERLTADYLIILGHRGHTAIVAEATFTPHGYGEKGFV